MWGEVYADKNSVYVYDYHSNKYLSIEGIDGATFKVLRFKSFVNAHCGPFLLADKSGLYHYSDSVEHQGGYKLQKIKDLSQEDLQEIAKFEMCEEGI